MISICFRWTGSNSNPENNDGQGRAGSDRSNILVLADQNYPEGNPGQAVPLEYKKGHFGNNFPINLKTPNRNFLGLGFEDLKNLAILTPGMRICI